MTETINFYVDGDVATGTALGKAIIHRAGTIKSVRGQVGTAGTTSSIIADVNKNGTTVFGAAGKLTIAATATTGTGVAFTSDAVAQVAAGDVITYDVDQADSGNTGVDLCVSIHIEYAQ